MTSYELSLIFGLIGIAFFLLEMSIYFKVEGDSFVRALVNGILAVLMRLMAIGTIIFDVFLMRIMLQDQTSSTAMTNILLLYDRYISFFMYGFVLIFFMLYFIHQFIWLVQNVNIWKDNKKSETKFKRFA